MWFADLVSTVTYCVSLRRPTIFLSHYLFPNLSEALAAISGPVKGASDRAEKLEGVT
jgi:hypothetical protein